MIGPGGAFVVVIRRCPHTVEYRDGKLFADSQSLGDVLTAAEVEAQLLTQLLRTPVVGVVALLEARFPPRCRRRWLASSSAPATWSGA